MLNFRKYLKDTSGNLSLTVAISSLVLTAGIGVAVETANMSRVQNKLQSQVDIATLTAAGTKPTRQEELDYSTLAFDVMVENGYLAENPKPEAVSNGTYLDVNVTLDYDCLLYTSPSPRDGLLSRMPSSA